MILSFNRNKLRYISIFFFLTTCLTGNLFSSEPVIVGKEFSSINMGPYVNVLMDSSHDLTIDDILKDHYQSLFERHYKNGFNYGMTEDAIWLRLRIKMDNDRTDNKKLILAMNNTAFPFVDLYLPDNKDSEKYIRVDNGYLRSTGYRTWQYRYPVFELPENLPENRDIFMRISPVSSATHSSANFSIYLSDEKNFRQKTWFEIALYSMLFGVLLSTIIYNAFLSFFLKDKVYHLYVLYISFIFFYLFLRSGFANLSGFPILTHYTLYIVSIAYIFGCFFSMSFLGIRKHNPGLTKIIWVLIAMASSVILLRLIGFPEEANSLIHITAVIGPLLLFIVGIISRYKGYKPARYYLAAWCWVLTGVVTFALVGMGLLPKNFFTINALFFGSTLEAVLLSTALGDRIRLLREEKIELQKKEHRLTEISITDELTSLYNKRWFSSKLLSEVEHSRRLLQPLSLMMIDVDHFKQFNDTFGHAAGDKVLSILGQCINKNIRDSDIPCRYGGEEFTVILPATDLDRAYFIAERLREKYASIDFQLNKKQCVRSTISIGVAQFSASDNEDTFFEKVDKALYQAKNQGRNQVVKNE